MHSQSEMVEMPQIKRVCQVKCLEYLYAHSQGHVSMENYSLSMHSQCNYVLHTNTDAIYYPDVLLHNPM